MSGAKFWRSAAACAVLSAFAAGQDGVGSTSSDRDPQDAVEGVDASGSDAVLGAVLSVSDLDEAWLVQLDRLRPASFRMLFIGLPDTLRAGFLVDFGDYGRTVLNISYPSAPIVLGYADGLDSFKQLFAKPDPMPPEVIGYEIALQGLEALLDVYYPDPKGPAYTQVRYIASTVATFKIS